MSEERAIITKPNIDDPNLLAQAPGALSAPKSETIQIRVVDSVSTNTIKFLCII